MAIRVREFPDWDRGPGWPVARSIGVTVLGYSPPVTYAAVPSGVIANRARILPGWDRGADGTSRQVDRVTEFE
jgi:hypothetical protein